METKNKLKSLTIQAAMVILFLEALPGIVAEINSALPMDISTNPLVVTILKYSSIAVVVYGRLRANTKLT